MLEGLGRKAAITMCGVATIYAGGRIWDDHYNEAQVTRDRDVSIGRDVLYFVGDAPHLINNMFFDVHETANSAWETDAQKSIPFAGVALIGAGVTLGPAALSARRRRKG